MPRLMHVSRSLLTSQGFEPSAQPFRLRSGCTCALRASQKALHARLGAARAKLFSLRARRITLRFRFSATSTGRQNRFRNPRISARKPQRFVREPFCFACGAKCAEADMPSLAREAQSFANEAQSPAIRVLRAADGLHSPDSRPYSHAQQSQPAAIEPSNSTTAPSSLSVREWADVNRTPRFQLRSPTTRTWQATP